MKYCKKIDKPIVSYKSIKNRLKTGDVIIMHSSSFIKGSLMKAYLGCDASHVAMIIKDKDELYIIELGPNGFHPLRKTDVRIRTLDDFISSSKHKILGLVECEKEIEFTLEDAKKYLDIKYNYFIPTIFSPYNKYKVCSNFVSMIHHDKGIETTKKHYEISPCDYYHSKNIIFFSK